jgi:hypothetical protein
MIMLLITNLCRPSIAFNTNNVYAAIGPSIVFNYVYCCSWTINCLQFYVSLVVHLRCRILSELLSDSRCRILSDCESDCYLANK